MPDESKPKLIPYEGHLHREADARSIVVTHAQCPVQNEGSAESREEAIKKAVSAINEGLTAGERVYVHCGSGMGRTSLVVACWFREQGQGLAQALDEIAKHWTGGPGLWGDKDMELVRAWREPRKEGVEASVGLGITGPEPLRRRALKALARFPAIKKVEKGVRRAIGRGGAG
jgi:hypothetical protein